MKKVRLITRGEVAARLGKSIATVRRLEETLQPTWDAKRHAYMFRADVVDKLADTLKKGQRLPGSASAWVRTTPSSTTKVAYLCGELAVFARERKDAELTKIVRQILEALGITP